MVLGLLFSYYVSELSGLAVTVNDMECVYEYVLYEGDTISGNFVVVDHDIFWSSDHPGIDFTVCTINFLHLPLNYIGWLFASCFGSSDQYGLIELKLCGVLLHFAHFHFLLIGWSICNCNLFVILQ